jgi:hemoglobin/transferrin/lactoferrin receptor protein
MFHRFKAICDPTTILLFIFFCVNSTQGQTIAVTDSQNEPMEGVTAYTEDLSYSALSNSLGILDFSDFPKGSSVIVSFYGYRPKTLLLNTDLPETIQLESISFFVDEFVLVGKDQRPLSQQIRQIEILKPDDIGSFQAQTPAELLANSGNVFVQKSQMGGGSPIIRGFEASRVLLVVDGVKMNNAIYRSGHLQNSITISNQALKQLEIIHGPASLLYGSDALGGVVHYRTKQPSFKTKDNPKTYKASISTSFNSVNNGTSISSINEISGKKFASLSVLSLSSFNDLKTGRKNIDQIPESWRRQEYQAFIDGRDTVLTNLSTNSNREVQSHVLKGTEYKQIDILQKFSYKISEELLANLNVQFSKSSDIPRYDQLSEKTGNTFRFAEWNYGPQVRGLIALQFNYTRDLALFNNSRLTLAYQKVEESRIRRRFKDGNRITNIEDLDVWSANWVFQKDFKSNRNQSLYYGIDFQSNNLNSTGFTEHIFGLTPNTFFSRYPSGLANAHNFGVFANYLLKNNNGKKQLNIGIRGSGHQTKLKFEDTSDFTWPSNYKDGSMIIDNSALVGSIAYKQKLSQNDVLDISVSNAFRAPNIDDLGKIRVKGDFVNIPNPNIRPEKTLTSELRYSRTDSKINFASSVFYTLARDLLVRRSSNEVLIPGYISLENTNASNGFIYGLNTQLKYVINQSLHISYNLGYSKGRYNYVDDSMPIDTMVAMAHIPPLFGTGSIQWKFQQFECALTHQFNGKKRLEDYEVLTISSDTEGKRIINREGSSDNIEYGFIDIEEGKSVYKDLPAWQTLNLHLSWNTDKQKVFLSIENIFDLHYRTFSSGLSAGGRNFALGLIFNY